MKIDKLNTPLNLASDVAEIKKNSENQTTRRDYFSSDLS